MSLHQKFLQLPIRNRMLVSYLTLFILALSLAGLGANFLLRFTIERHMRTEFENTTRTIHNLVRTAADVSIRNHLRSVVETNLKTLHALHNQVLSGILSKEEAQERAKAFFRIQPIGHTGYIYVLDSQGALQHHMDPTLVGENMSHFDFVRDQTKTRDGYIEYEWKNPGEEKTRPKALHMGYFEPWDWIVSASSYREEFRDLLRIEDFRHAIHDLKFGDSGYALLLDTKGELLIHPFIQPQNIGEWLDTEGKPIIRKIIQANQTIHHYRWQNPADPAPREKVVLSIRIPELDFVVAATGYMEEFNAPLRNLGQTLALGFFLYILILVPLTAWLGRSITRPIENLTRTMKEAEKGDFSLRVHTRTGGEPGELAHYFNRFMDHIQNHRDALEREIAQRRNSEEKARLLARFPDENPHPVLRIRQDFVLDYMNKAAMEQLTEWRLVEGEEIPPLWQQVVTDCARHNSPRSVEVEASDRTFLFTACPIDDKKAWYLYGHEITEKKAYEKLLLLSDTVFQNTIEGICITNAEGLIDRVNPAFSFITGYSPEDAMGQNPRILKSDLHTPEFYKEMWDSLIHRGEWSGEIWNRRKNGETYPQWLAITAVRNEIGETVRYIGVFHDISELKTSKEALHFQTFHDALTGLGNRRMLTDRLERALSHARYHNEKLAVLFLDLDNFKNVNDSLGHIIGDRILKEMAARLARHTREDETLARFAGDKFVLVLPRIQTSQAAVSVASRLQDLLSRPFSLEDREYFATLSMGMAFFPDDGNDEETLLKNAETAMYRAKQAGKNRISLFAPAMNAQALQRMDLETRLRKAMEKQEFHLVFQPKVDLISGKIIGAEALLRWQPADGPPVSPVSFIPLAEDTGLILPIGAWVLEKALEEATLWQKMGFTDLSIAVNLSASQFQQKELTSQIDVLLKKTGLPPQLLELELTESVIMGDASAAIDTLCRFSQMGIRFAVDDFGTGYSSLSYLKRFPIQVLKIDKSFIQEIPHNRDDAAIVLSILSLAHSLGLKVVAEGVETEAQLAFLRSHKCDMIQGYLFSRPLPPDAFRELVSKRSSLRPLTIL
jgi:diguanylate cyclase (GGDEF)-like protein/PAS domain S-box-containing protein